MSLCIISCRHKLVSNPDPNPSIETRSQYQNPTSTLVSKPDPNHDPDTKPNTSASPESRYRPRYRKPTLTTFPKTGPGPR